MKDSLPITFHNITLLLFLLFSFSIFGQEEVYFLDDKIKGRAYYETEEDQSNRSGLFYFESLQQDTLDPSIYYKYSLKGGFQDKVMNGGWRYDYKKLTPIGDLHIDSLGFKESAEGQHRSVKGRLNGGELFGKWKVIETEVDFSRVVDTTVAYRFEFEENKLTGSFSIRNEQSEIYGEVDQQGFLHGELRFSYLLDGQVIRDSRTFDHGRLIESYITVDQQEANRKFIGLEVPAKYDNQYVTLPLNADYLSVIELSQHFSGRPFEPLNNQNLLQYSDVLLLQSIQAVTEHNEVSIWPDQPSIIFPNIKLAEIDNAQSYTSIADSLTHHFARLKSRLKQILKDEQVEIIAEANQEVKKYQAIYAAIDQQYRFLFQPVVEVVRQPGSKYLNMNTITSKIMEGKSVPTEISLENESVLINMPFETTSKDLDELQQMNSHIMSLLAFMDSLDRTVSDVLSYEKKSLSLTDDEKEMVELRDSIRLLFSKSNQNDYLKRFSTQVIQETDNTFADYAKLDLNEKVNKLAEVNRCFQSYLNFYEVLAELPEQRKLLDSIYTRTVWNPFTFTDMNEIVKERLFNAYDKVLFPYLLDQIEAQLGCATVNKIVHDIPRVFERMLELRDMDTKDIEKELKRENDPLVVETILQMELQLF